MNINQENLLFNRNGDQVIMTMKAKDLKTKGGYHDFSTLTQWYQEDPLKNHLGLQSFFGQQTKVSYPIYQELLANKAVLEVNGWEGSFTYDTPIESVDELMTVADNSNQEYAGLDEGLFKITLNEELAPGTTLTADAMFGLELAVSDAQPVKAKGDGFEHIVTLNTANRDTWYPSYLLAKGISYYVTGHGTPEYGTDFAKVRMPKTTAYETSEFRLGSVRGAEAYVTGKADSVNLGGAIAQSKDYQNKLMEEADRLGELMVMMDLDKSGRPIKNTQRIGATMQYLVFRELDRLTANSLLFQRAGTVRTANGNVRYNEGLWHQLRRGKIITYGKPGGITREHIKEAAEYVFRQNPDKPTIERRIRFKCGTQAYQNVLEIFDEEVNQQLTRLASLRGDAAYINNPVSGDNYNLALAPVRFTQVYIKDLGNVEIVEDTSLNRIHLADRLQGGMHDSGHDHTSYSMVIWDVEDAQYSNNKDLPKGTKLVDGGKKNANIYIVKPEGEFMYWGTENGRYHSDKSSDIVSSSKFMQMGYWAFNNCSVWVKQVEKFVMIELDPSQRKGFK